MTVAQFAAEAAALSNAAAYEAQQHRAALQSAFAFEEAVNTAHGFLARPIVVKALSSLSRVNLVTLHGAAIVAVANFDSKQAATMDRRFAQLARAAAKLDTQAATLHSRELAVAHGEALIEDRFITKGSAILAGIVNAAHAKALKEAAQLQSKQDKAIAKDAKRSATPAKPSKGTSTPKAPTAPTFVAPVREERPFTMQERVIAGQTVKVKVYDAVRSAPFQSASSLRAAGYNLLADLMD